VSQSKNRLFDPYMSSYKEFKEGFFKVLFEGEGWLYVFANGSPKFPLYWTREPTWYGVWPGWR